MTCRWHVRAAERLFRRKANPSKVVFQYRRKIVVFLWCKNGRIRRGAVVNDSPVDCQSRGTAFPQKSESIQSRFSISSQDSGFFVV